MIIRAFRARVRAGTAVQFRRFFVEEALPLVRAQEGLIRAEIGWPMRPGDDAFLMITVWRDLDCLRAFAGDDWQAARILPEEEAMLCETTVHHDEAASVSD